MTRKTPEGYVLDAVMQYLAAKRIFALRMNSGAIRMQGQNGRTRVFKGHDAGTGDVLALHVLGEGMEPDRRVFLPHWIECKAPNGKQTELQKSFQQRVEEEGHVYILAYGIDDLERAGL
jgi:hypothetical protein